MDSLLPRGRPLALVGALLSASGVALLVLDARLGVAAWDEVFWQIGGCLAGFWCFAALMRRTCQAG